MSYLYPCSETIENQQDLFYTVLLKVINPKSRMTWFVQFHQASIKTNYRQEKFMNNKLDMETSFQERIGDVKREIALG